MLLYNSPKDGAVARSQSLRVHSRCTRTPQCLPAHPKAGPSTLGKGKWKRGKRNFIFYYYFFPHGVTFSRTDQNADEFVAICRAGTVPQEGCAGSSGCPWGCHRQQERAVPSLVRALGFSKASRSRSCAGSVTAAHTMVQSRDQTSCCFITFI